MRTGALLLPFLLSVCAGLLCRAQGDVFSTNTSPDRSACDQARQAEETRYSQNIAALVAKYQASAPASGPPDLARLRQYASERGNEDTRHAKAMAALDAGVCSYLRQTGSSPCDQANYREDKLYEQNMSKLAQRRLQEDNDANNQRLACASDANCISTVNQKALKVLQAWAADRAKEAERHLNALAQIRQGNCSPTVQRPANNTSLGPLQAGASLCTSGPCCYTPARGPQCLAVRFGWGNCPGSSQACDVCYGPNGVFAYVPRGSVYTLSSGCTQLGPNAIWATRSAQTAQAMQKAGGNCTPDGKGGYLCTNVNPNQFQSDQPQPPPNPSPPARGGGTCTSGPCCYTPARGPQCPAVRFGWGNCPGSSQACEVCYGPDGVFAYTPRGSAYTLSSGCTRFGPNTIWATRSSQTAQAMTRAGGNCTSDGHGGYNCTNVDLKRYQQPGN